MACTILPATVDQSDHTATVATVSHTATVCEVSGGLIVEIIGDWVLDGGIWADAGVWRDTEVWED